MSIKQDLQKVVEAYKNAKKETAKEVSKAAEQVDTLRQVQTEQPFRQD